MVTTVRIIELVVFYILSLSVGYLFLFTIASKFYKKRKYTQTEKMNRFAVLFPAYQEDKVIIQSVTSFLKQDYPKDKYEVIVISDHMQDATNEALSQLPIRLIKANYTDSSKAKAMSLAMDVTENEDYDMIVIMDADNLTTSVFLQEINKAKNEGVKAIQAHRIAKNTDSDIAVLDAISEEINNTIFRKGHVALGFSSALIGSGMAFDVNWFRSKVKNLNTAGEDKELEIQLLKERIYIEYLDHIIVYDEKTKKINSLQSQRKRWLAAQFGSLKMALSYFPKALFLGNFDYCDKVIQWAMLPRIILIGIILFILITSSFFNFDYAIKWYFLFLVLCMTLLGAIPKKMINKKMFFSIIKMPLVIMIFITNLFRLKGVNKKFIHTKHSSQ